MNDMRRMRGLLLVVVSVVAMSLLGPAPSARAVTPTPADCTIFVQNGFAYGTPGDDVICGTPGRDVILGYGGEPYLRLDAGFLDATTLMEALIGRGVPMRSAHEAVGNLVRECEQRECRLADLPDDELVCRCEEVSAGAVRRACSELGVDDTRGAKLMTRAGMGLCQGRICGRAVRDLIEAHTGRIGGDESLARAGERLPAIPVTLRSLAGGSSSTRMGD